MDQEAPAEESTEQVAKMDSSNTSETLLNEAKQSFDEMKRLYQKIETNLGKVISTLMPATTADVSTQVDEHALGDKVGSAANPIALDDDETSDVAILDLPVKDESKSTFESGELVDNKSTLSTTATTPQHSFTHEDYYSREKMHTWLRVRQINCTEENCTEIFKSTAKFYEHMSSVHQINYYLCHAANCKQSFRDMDRLKAHLESEHADITAWTCPDCERIFREHAFLHMHKLFHHQVGIFSCKQCSLEAQYRINILRHSEHCSVPQKPEHKPKHSLLSSYTSGQKRKYRYPDQYGQHSGPGSWTPAPAPSAPLRHPTALSHYTASVSHHSYPPSDGRAASCAGYYDSHYYPERELLPNGKIICRTMGFHGTGIDRRPCAGDPYMQQQQQQQYQQPQASSGSHDLYSPNVPAYSTNTGRYFTTENIVSEKLRQIRYEY